MANFNVEGAQNVEISKKLPCEKPLIVQLEIMERYTAVHKACAALPKEIREVECLKVLYPTLFRKITDQDLIAGRTDFLPIGFGCVTSLGSGIIAYSRNSVPSSNNWMKLNENGWMRYMIIGWITI